jgi:hypothetical protein
MRPREINNVKFLLEWINKIHSVDFVIDESYKDEDSHIDVLLKSSKTDEFLKIQNVAYREGTIHRTAKVTFNGKEVRIPNFKPVLALGIDMSYEKKRETIINTIKSKQDLYPEELSKDTVLLVEFTIPSTSLTELNKLFKEKEEFNFRGIYFVQLPVNGQNGFVYPFKDFFKND